MFKLGYSTQPDVTVGTEIVPPPFGTLNEAIKSLNSFWEKWLVLYPSCAPLMKGSGHNSTIGGHQHLGLRHRKLNSKEALSVIKHLSMIYPFTTAIMANDFKPGVGVSYRNKHNSRVVNLPEDVFSSTPNNPVIPTGHYDEMNYTRKGTVELRRYDSNIPQAHLTVAFIEKTITLAALSGEPVPASPKNCSRISEMSIAIKKGLTGLDFKAYFDWWLSSYEKYIIKALDDEKGILADSVTEILGLAYNGYCPQDLAINLGIYWNPSKEFEYFRAMVSDSRSYIKHLVKLGYDIPKAYLEYSNFDFTKAIRNAVNWFVPDLSTTPEFSLRLIEKWRNAGLNDVQITTRLNSTKGFKTGLIMSLDKALRCSDTKTIVDVTGKLRPTILNIRNTVVELYPSLDNVIPRNCIIGSVYTPQELDLILNENPSFSDIDLLEKYTTWLLFDEDTYNSGKREILGYTIVRNDDRTIMVKRFKNDFGEKQMLSFLEKR